MKLIVPLFVLLSVLVTNTAFAGKVDGNKLLKVCKIAIRENRTLDLRHEEYIGVGYCLGLMIGITSLNKVYEVMEGQDLFCLPKNNITNGQAARIVLKYLEDHPEKLHELGSTLSIRAFQEAYPCK